MHGPEAACVAHQKNVIKNEKIETLIKALSITD